MKSGDLVTIDRDWRGCNLYTYPTCEGDVVGILHDPKEAMLVLCERGEERTELPNGSYIIRDMCLVLTSKMDLGWIFSSYLERVL